MATHDYTRTTTGSIPAAEGKTFVTGTFSVPSGETFSRYKVTHNSSIALSLMKVDGSHESMLFNTWYTNTSWINWTNGGTATLSLGNPTTSKANNVTVTVTFQTSDVTYSVTCNVLPEGTGTLTASPASTVKNTTVTLTPTPAEGYKFIGYTSSVTITNSQFTMPASAVTITANFKSIYEPETITFSITNPGRNRSEGIIYLPKKIPPFSDIDISYTFSNNTYRVFSLYLTDSKAFESNPGLDILFVRAYEEGNEEYNVSQLSNLSTLVGQSKLIYSYYSSLDDTVTVTITYTPNGKKSRTISTNNIHVLEDDNDYLIITFPKPIDNVDALYSIQYKDLIPNNYLSNMYVGSSRYDPISENQVMDGPPLGSQDDYIFTQNAAQLMQGAQSFLLECYNDQVFGENPSFSITYGYEGNPPVSQIGYYNGRFFEPCTINYYNGTQFVECNPYYYNGTAWVPISTT